MAEVLVLRIDFEANGFKNTVFPTVITDASHMVLMDCGYPGFIPYLEAALAQKGHHLDRLTHIIVTHHDFDHMGSLRALKDKYPHVKVLASEVEAPYIAGKSKSLRLAQAEALYDSLPDNAKPGAFAFQKMLEGVEKCDVDEYLADGQVLPFCGGIRVIATPGHMPGHIALYHIPSQTVVVGDAMVMEGGNLGLANPQYTLDMDLAIQSIQKLSELSLKALVCYHGGICQDNPNEAIKIALNL